MVILAIHTIYLSLYLLLYNSMHLTVLSMFHELANSLDGSILFRFCRYYFCTFVSKVIKYKQYYNLWFQ